MKKLLLFFATIFFCGFLNAQTPGCAGAANLNLGMGFPMIASPQDTSIDYGCVTVSSQHDVWFGYFTVCQSGTCDILSYTSGLDSIGIVVWGPFTTTAGICQNLVQGSIVACSTLWPTSSQVSVGNVLAGEIYMVAVVSDSAWANPSFQSSGTAVITGNCSPPPPPNPGPGCALGAVDLNVNPSFGPQGSLDEPTINYGCVNTAGQWIWYGYFTVCQGGSMNIHGAINTSAYDADITVWGPFPNATNLCSQLNSGNIFACAASTGTDVINMGNISIGEVYMVGIACNDSTASPFLIGNGTADISGTCVPPPPCAPVNGYEMLCVVTVDSATQEYQLIWNEVPGNPVTHFGIMKNDFMNVPQQIDTVQISSLSQYIDVSADPGVHHETYSIRVYDTCATSWYTGYYIRPVFCQSSLSTQATVNVSWSDYLDASGNGPVYYVIYRGSTPANMVSMDTVSYTTTSWTDVNPPAGMSYYKIGVALYSQCTPMRLQQSTQSQYWVQSFSNAAPVTVVGVGENSLQEVSLFPNPSDGNITVKNLNAVSVMSVYDLAGRVVLQQQLQANGSQQISLENLEPGIYSLTIENETGFFREEVVIRH
jgi:hypothetical protein